MAHYRWRSRVCQKSKRPWINNLQCCFPTSVNFPFTSSHFQTLAFPLCLVHYLTDMPGQAGLVLRIGMRLQPPFFAGGTKAQSWLSKRLSLACDTQRTSLVSQIRSSPCFYRWTMNSMSAEWDPSQETGRFDAGAVITRRPGIKSLPLSTVNRSSAPRRIPLSPPSWLARLNAKVPAS